MANIAASCDRGDLFAFYRADDVLYALPVIGFSADGRALVLTCNGLVPAAKARPKLGYQFDCTTWLTEAQRAVVAQRPEVER
jgi:hypothetical protein